MNERPFREESDRRSFDGCGRQSGRDMATPRPEFLHRGEWHRCDICLAISLSWRKGSLQAAYTNGIDRHLISARQSEENAVRLIEFCCRGVQAGTRPLNNSSTVSINFITRSEEHTSELQSLMRIS